MLDRYWFGDVERISPEAPVPVVRITGREDRLGGAANVAFNCVTLGAQTLLMSVVGKDEAGESLNTLCKKSKVPASLRVDQNMTTTIKLRVIGQRQQLLRIDFEEQPDHEILQLQLDQYRQRLKDFDVVVFSDYSKGGLHHIPAMIAEARSQGKTVVVDPKGDDYARYRQANLITPNRAELAQVVGRWQSEEDLQERVQSLRRQFDIGAILLTRSEEGMSLYSDAAMEHEPTQAQEVFDVSGAGDTVVATMAVMKALGEDWLQAMKIANRAAGIVVGRLGTAAPRPEEIWN